MLGAKIGPSTLNVVEQLLADRPLDRLRSVQAILQLEESVGSKRLEAACARAAHFGDVRYRQIKLILNAALDREPLPQAQPAKPALSHTFARRGEEFFGGAHDVSPAFSQVAPTPTLGHPGIPWICVLPRQWISNWLRSSSWLYCSTMNWSGAANNTRY